MQDPLFSDHPGFSTEHELRVMQRSRVGSIRVAFYGFNTMPVKGGPPDLDGVDDVVLQSAKHDLRVLPVLLGLPAWAREYPKVTYSAPTAKGRAAYAALAEAFVKRYGPRGTLWKENPGVEKLPMRTFQIWNEVRLGRFWKSKENRVRAYVKLLRSAALAIRGADAGAEVLAAGEPGKYPSMLKRLYSAGGRRWFDAVAAHPFTFEVPNVQVIIERYRRVLDQHHDEKKPVYLTELSWPSAFKKTDFQYGYETTEREQAVKLRQAYRMLDRQRKRLKIGGVYWATWVTRDHSRHDSFDYSGLRNYDAKYRVTAKPAFRAFVTTIRRLVGA